MASQKRWTEIQGLHVLKDEPELRMLVLDINDSCNFDCLYCYAKSDVYDYKKRERLTLDEYLTLFEEAKKLGVESVWFTGGHENTLSRDFLRIVEKLEELGLYSPIITNGAVFGDDHLAQRIHGMSARELTQKVAECTKSSVILKFDSFNEQVQNTLAGNNHAYQQIQEALSNLMDSSLYESGKSGFPRLGINSVVTRLNYDEIGDIFDFALRKGLVYFCDDLLMTGDAKRNQDRLLLSDEERRKCYDGIEKVLHKHGMLDDGIKPEDVINSYDHECILFDNYIFVLGNGEVIPCASFNDREASIGNVRNGLDRIRTAKLKVIKKYYSSCPDCNKCPCRAYLEGDLK